MKTLEMFKKKKKKVLKEDDFKKKLTGRKKGKPTLQESWITETSEFSQIYVKKLHSKSMSTKQSMSGPISNL